MRKRYLVVSHPVEEEQHKIVDNKIVGKQPAHDLLSGYHWVRLDKAHILLLAETPLHTHKELHAHDKVSVLPSITSSKSLHHHFTNKLTNKHHHHNSLINHFGIDETHTMEDLQGMIESKYGPLFSLDH